MKNFKIFALFIFFLGVYLSFVIRTSLSINFLEKLPANKNIEQIDYNHFTLINCAPRGGLHGENWLGYDFIRAMNEKFSVAEQIFQGEAVNNTSGVNVYLRGYFKYFPPFPNNQHINIAYIFYPVFFSHYDVQKISLRDRLKPKNHWFLQSFFDEMQYYDALAVASVQYAEKMKNAGFKTYYIPQFTDEKRFYPEYDETLQSDILFIGGQPHLRKAPQILLQHHYPITIYGPDNGGFADKQYIDNNILHKYYSSAKIVLNDHREDMKLHGFINNRTFDVTASGGFLISDYMPEIEEIYGDCIPMWKTEKELISLVDYYLAPEHENERLEKAKCAREITLKNFTADITAQKFMQIIDDIRKEKGI